MDRVQKAELVTALQETFAETSVVVVTRNRGLTVAHVNDLRRKAQKAGAQYKVVKNRLASIAAEGSPYAHIQQYLVGPTALTLSADPVAAAKVIADFAKLNDKLEIVGGAMGSTLLDANSVKALAELPSLDQLRATLIGLVNAPATKIARLATAPAAKLARVFTAYAESEQVAA